MLGYYSQSCFSEIYQCKNDAGKLSYQDYKCNGYRQVKISYDKHDINSTDESDTKGRVLTLKSKGGMNLMPKIVINQVKLVLEKENLIQVEVVYTYNNSIPSEEFRISARPLKPQWSSVYERVHPGKNTVLIPILLSESNMKYSGLAEISSESLSVTFLHEKSKTSMANTIYYYETYTFNKHWEL